MSETQPAVSQRSTTIEILKPYDTGSTEYVELHEQLVIEHKELDSCNANLVAAEASYKAAKDEQKKQAERVMHIAYQMAHGRPVEIDVVERIHWSQNLVDIIDEYGEVIRTRPITDSDGQSTIWDEQ